MVRKKALVTGASSGIGRAFAYRLAELGYDLAVVARREHLLVQIKQELEERHSISVQVLPLDLTLSSHRQKLYEQVPQVDLLVNNAGIGWITPFVDMKVEEVRSILELNVVAVTEIAHFYLQTMVERKRGEMVIVASTAAFQPIPYFAIYGATKGYDYLLGVALHAEYKPFGVHVLTLCPGPTYTEFGRGHMDLDKAIGRLGMTAEKVVEAALLGLRKKKAVVIPGFLNKLGIWLQKFFPRCWTLAISRLIFRRVYQKSKMPKPGKQKESEAS